MKLAAYDFRKPQLLDNDEIADILSKADELVSWVSDIKGYALSALIRGEQIDGYKLVAGRSIRKYTDEEKVADVVREAGLEPYAHTVKGITAMTAMLGKKRFNELLGTLITKPAGKPTIASESDRRPACLQLEWQQGNRLRASEPAAHPRRRTARIQVFAGG